MFFLLLKDPASRRWLMAVVLVVIFFMLLAWIAWLYYDYEMTRLTAGEKTIL